MQKKTGKVADLEKLPMDLRKFGGNELQIHLLEVLNNVIDKTQMSQERETAMVKNTHKSGTKSKCENYTAITLLPTAYKLFENVINNSLNEHFEDEIAEEQCGFRNGRSCKDATLTVQQIIEKKRKEHNLPIFPNYEKAYDNVNRHKLWGMMGNKIPNYLLNTIKCIYRNTKVRINDGINEPIHINKGVRQGCGLSPVLFNI